MENDYNDLLSRFIASGDHTLDKILLFTAEIDKMTSVLRRTILIDRSRRENDAEHSWHISVMALLFEKYAVERPNVLHAVEMMLVHDLVEIYAGDTFAYDIAGNASKKEREKLAADKLYALLPADQSAYLRSLWEEFDAAETTDAKYANCLDRLQPFLHNTLTKGYTWSNYGFHTKRAQVAARMDILREFMPAVHEWVVKCMDTAVRNGWLDE
ncbi:MAG: HD domain-containing protein [Victivallales bacterium]|nr:HD domain-containing protein [Victivallales bacterium]